MTRPALFTIVLLLAVCAGLGWQVYSLSNRLAAIDEHKAQEKREEHARIADADRRPSPDNPVVIGAPKTTPPVADVPPEDPAAVAKKERVKKLLESTNWKRIAKALMGLLKADEESRRTGKPMSFDPELQPLITENLASMLELQNLLGLKSYWDVPFNKDIAPYFIEGWMDAVGVELAPDQLAKLQDMTIEGIQARDQYRDKLSSPSRLDRFLAEGQLRIAMEQRVSTVLTPEQYAKYSLPQGNDPFFGLQANRTPVPSDSVTSTANVTTDYWMKTLGIPDSQRPIVQGIATEYSEKVHACNDAFNAQYPSNPPRDAVMQHQVDLLKIQTDSEQELSQRVTLPPGQQSNLLNGSGTILQPK